MASCAIHWRTVVAPHRPHSALRIEAVRTAARRCAAGLSTTDRQVTCVQPGLAASDGVELLGLGLLGADEDVHADAVLLLCRERAVGHGVGRELQVAFGGVGGEAPVRGLVVDDGPPVVDEVDVAIERELCGSGFEKELALDLDRLDLRGDLLVVDPK